MDTVSILTFVLLAVAAPAGALCWLARSGPPIASKSALRTPEEALS